MEDTQHFLQMLRERGISREWVDLAVAQPDVTESRDDGTIHYLKQIEAFEHRWLRVVVNVLANPPRRITAFFDRRLKQSHESQS